MARFVTLRRVFFLALVGLLILSGAATSQAPQRSSQVPQRSSQAPQRSKPRLEPVAETKLLMEGMNLANFRGLEGLLKKKPADDEAWKFARGQALLIAETGNLLMLRPPRNQGQDAWMDRATELRTAAARLARNAGDQDYERSRAGLTEVANACNRCHQTFRVPARLKPFAETRAQND